MNIFFYHLDLHSHAPAAPSHLREEPPSVSLRSAGVPAGGVGPSRPLDIRLLQLTWVVTSGFSCKLPMSLCLITYPGPGGGAAPSGGERWTQNE